MIRTVWLILSCLVFAGAANAQSVNVYLTDSTIHTYALADVQKVTHDENELALQFIEGSVLTWNFSVISFIDYNDLGLGVTDSQKPFVLDFSIFPNPASDIVNIRFESGYVGQINVSVFDFNGRLTDIIYKGETLDGSLNLSWNGRTEIGKRVRSGVYFCVVEFGEIRISRTMIIIDK